MKSEKLKELEEEYELELEKLIENINKIKKKNPQILLQFPDGLKQYATDIIDYLKEKINKNVEIKIWLGSCFGACDIPNSESDLLVQFGHAPWD